MIELDEAAVEAAIAAHDAVYNDAGWADSGLPEEDRQAMRASITAYLDATRPDTAAMEAEFIEALGQYGLTRTSYFRGEDVTWRSVQDSERTVLDLFRTAATR